ncbi:hypothetical protein LAZ67_X001577 [Cordylochernes scorpioides]|uniref:Transposable element Tcb2 transposase n=1 Tax=Cordylochernes scorpioides TaxID=51811 RepID=A0ABY6LWN8_9ARAC|nr:hypothetical protein LAZ67_X001577 [Cordylochernes scorpioides]
MESSGRRPDGQSKYPPTNQWGQEILVRGGRVAKYGNSSLRHEPSKEKKVLVEKEKQLPLKTVIWSHREMRAIQLSNELSSATGTRISRQTVYRRLHEGALYARRPMVCIPLTSAHRRARLNWCLEHHAWTHDQWANVLFSDESRFSLNTDSRRVFLWREPGTRYHLSNIREIDSFREGSLLVWAGISSSRRTPLHIFSGGTLTAQRYRDEILEPYLRPYRDQIGHNLIFMDHNARPHRARLVNEYLQSENIRRMDWPARSPDLNPIEHVWDALGRRIGARHPSPRTLVELRTALLEEWGLLPLDLLQSLVNSMRARCETLIAVRAHLNCASSTSILDSIFGAARADFQISVQYFSSTPISTVSRPRRKIRAHYKHMSEFETGRAIGLKEAGWSNRLIARHLCGSDAAIRRCWQKWVNNGSMQRQDGSGRPRATTEREDRAIVRMAVAAPESTLSTIQRVTGTQVSKMTINRRPRAESKSSPTVTMPTPHTRATTIFSDESRFLLCPDDRRKRVWRRPGQRVDPGLTVEHHTGPQQGVMVWSTISFDSRTPLVVIPGTLTAQRYVDDILRPVLLPFLSYHPGLTFQQDNARPHTARVTMDCLQSCRNLSWPARSPDLSPIEHI